jgi:hypothetical protein
VPFSATFFSFDPDRISLFDEGVPVTRGLLVGRVTVVTTGEQTKET